MDPTDTTGEQPLGPAGILAAENWSLLATRSLLWNDRISTAPRFPTPAEDA